MRRRPETLYEASITNFKRVEKWLKREEANLQAKFKILAAREKILARKSAKGMIPTKQEQRSYNTALGQTRAATVRYRKARQAYDREIKEQRAIANLR